jgi:hypothetical protein
VISFISITLTTTPATYPIIAAIIWVFAIQPLYKNE